ncbi:DUF4012 domain-containing protein [Microterricola viridarii]|uniref:DUF4012 domain-containing protein n=1 Tax=Microterricola viridarii TaxID=412690 RepID=A0A1H1QZX8_9MICO|nr:DUF4012 domain-containing protein [Microterricola viridarii]SDS28815.1 Protein of unknown function [Microterricola viridarii]
MSAVEEGTTGRPDAARRRAWRVGLLCAAAVLLLALLAGGWLTLRVLNAKSALEDGEALVRTVAAQLTTGDLTTLPSASAELSALSSTAVEQTADPVWRVAELVPGLGVNLSALRAVAESVDHIARETVAPLSSVAGTLTIDTIKPFEGRIDVEKISSLSRSALPAATAFREAAARIAAVDFTQTVPPLAAVGQKLTAQLAEAMPVVDELSTTLSLAPDALGASGPRSYLLMFQNLAESTALGGTAAALAEVTVNNGAIALVNQASSQSFGRDLNAPALPVDPGVAAIFNPYMYATLNLATSRPDFPTAAVIASAFWERDFGTRPDGVISIDPVALSYILQATGPVELDFGGPLTAENAVSLLLNEIYIENPGPDGPDITDAFFAMAAREIFDALSRGNANTHGLVDAVERGVAEHRIMAWSANPAEQAVLASTPLSGILPTDNTAASVTGVFFRDMSASKIDYYLHTAATLTSSACGAEPPHFTAQVELHSSLTQEQADALPEFVSGGVWQGRQFKTQVFVYGPPGTTLSGAEIEAGGDEETFVGHSGADLGRPVATYWVMLSPGETVTLSARFDADAPVAGGASGTVSAAAAVGTFGPSALRTTPMLNPTTTTVIDAGCGGH